MSAIAANLHDDLRKILNDEPKKNYKITLGSREYRAGLQINHSIMRVDIVHAAEYGDALEWLDALEHCRHYDMPDFEWHRIQHVGTGGWDELRLIVEED